MNFRILDPLEDFADFKTLRLKGMKEIPEVFAESYEEARQKSKQEFKYHLADHGVGDFVFGAFEGGKLIAVAGFYRETGSQHAHKGSLWGVYVDVEHRGKGAARRIVSAVIQKATEAKGLTHIKLTVGAHNKPALFLYQELGFTIYGTELQALKVKGHFHDEHLMQLVLPSVQS